MPDAAGDQSVWFDDPITGRKFQTPLPKCACPLRNAIALPKDRMHRSNLMRHLISVTTADRSWSSMEIEISHLAGLLD